MLRRLPRPRRRLLLAVTAATAIALLVVVLAAVVVPGLVRRAAVQRLEALVTVPVAIGPVHVNLLTGRARISDVVIGGLNDGAPILRLAALDVGVSYRGLLRGTARLRYLTFQQPRLFIERTGPESINVLQAMRLSAGGATDFTIERASVQGGAVAFVDRTQTPVFERHFEDITLTTDRVSNMPALRFTPTSFELRLGIGSGGIVVTGATTPFARPAGIELTARMERLDPGVLQGYFPLRARVDLRGSRVDGDVRYRLVYQGDRVVENRLTARVETGPIRFLPPDDDTPLVGVAGVVGRDIEADFVRNTVRLGDVTLRAPDVRLVRGPAGLNVATLVGREAEAGQGGGGEEGVTRQAARPTTPPAPPVTVVVGRLVVEGGAIDFADATTRPTFGLAVRQIGLQVQDLAVGGTPRPGRLAGALLLAGGRVAFDGTLDGGSLATRLRLTAAGLSLDAFRPYIEPALRGVTARGGVVDGRLDAAIGARSPSGVPVELSGRVEGRQLAVALPGATDPSLTLPLVTVDLASMRLLPGFEADIARIRLTGPSLRVTREPDGTLDLGRLSAPAPEASGDGRRESGASQLAVRRIDVAAGRVEFADRAVSPVFRAVLRGLDTQLVRPDGRAGRMAVRLAGRLGEAPVQLRGWIEPFGPSLRLELAGHVDDYDLPALDPYAVRYVSQHLGRGRVSARVAASYGDGRYVADSTLTIRHLQLGAPVNDGPEAALGIPLELAVSLLEGRDRSITLHLPIRGGPEGREVDFRDLVMTVVRNTVVKVASAPFRAFGALVTLGGRIGQVRIDPVEFEPGSLAPGAEAAARLARVIEFLEDRPRLGLELRGVASPDETEAYKRERLREALKHPPPTLPDAPLLALYREAGGPATRDERPTEEMEQYLLDQMRVTDVELRALATERARVIQEALVRRGVERGRLFLAPEGTSTAPGSGPGRVEFRLVY